MFCSKDKTAIAADGSSVWELAPVSPWRIVPNVSEHVNAVIFKARFKLLDPEN
jgi:hypothetical protein